MPTLNYPTGPLHEVMRATAERFPDRPAITFKDEIDTGVLPQDRAPYCEREYQQVRRAFAKTILPHVDLELMKKVQSVQWLRPADGRK